MKWTTIILAALFAVLVAGCESTPRNNEPEPENNEKPEPTPEANGSEETTPDESTPDEGQDTKNIIYVLGVDGMD